MVSPTRLGDPPIRDQVLLDTLEALPKSSFRENVWRTVRDGSDPLICSRSGGRWDDGTFDVLYTSETKEGALAECRFHLYQGQPIPPSKIQYALFELEVDLANIFEFKTVAELAKIGLREETFGQASYNERLSEYVRSQEIAEACAFLGADGLRVPNARGLALFNIVVFCEHTGKSNLKVIRRHGIVDI